jgi:hypothetical protein
MKHDPEGNPISQATPPKDRPTWGDGEGEQNLLNIAANAPEEALGALASGGVTAPIAAAGEAINELNENRVQDSPLATLPNNVSAADTWTKKFGGGY